jgi:hypothetical protein
MSTPRPDKQNLGKRKTDHGKTAFFAEGGTMKDGKKMMSKVAAEKVKGHEKRMHGAKGGKSAQAGAPFANKSGNPFAKKGSGKSR